MTTPQVLSDEQLLETFEQHKSQPGPALRLAIGRAIESATLKALSGQEPVAWAVEYGAISLPQGHQSRITSWEVYAAKEAAEAAAIAMDFDSRILPVGFPPAQPAQVDDLVNALNKIAYEAIGMREVVEIARAALQGAQAPQAKGDEQ